MEASINERLNVVFKHSESKSMRAWAIKLGVAQTTLTDILRGESEPKYNTLRLILECEPLISAEWLMRGVGPMELQSGVGNSTINIQKQGAHAINAGGSVNAPSSNDAEVVKRLMDQMDGLRAELSALRAQNEKLTNKLLGL